MPFYNLYVRSQKSLLIWLLIFAAGVAVVSAMREWRAPAPSASPPASGATITGRAKVIDGDSLEIAGEPIRLFGIDAPEGRQSCRDASGQLYACGHEAQRTLVSAIAGRTVTCTPVEHDRYDRSVALCTAGGRDLAETMVRQGHAVELPHHSGGRYTAAEREARAAKRGMWAGSFDRPAEWRQRNMR
jgi:endonuclease YncB( thermonuclease family)